MAPGPPTRRAAPRARRAAPAAVPALLLLALALAGCTAPAPSPDGGASPGGHGGHGTGPLAPSALDRSVEGLPASQPMGEARLEPGAPFALAAAPVAHDPGLGHPIRMFAYNGQLPGPVLRAAQGARVEVAFTNHLPVPTTVHWHGIRLAPEHDGVPGLSQDPVPPGGSFRYVLDLPDEGAYWYHAHVREDLQQELGLAGLLLVEGPDHGEGPREVPLVLDDLLVQGSDVAAFGEAANRALMGRYGNLLMANGGSSWQGEAQPGERVRLVLVNAANARPLRLWLDGAAKAKWVGIDGGFFDAPRPWPGALVLAPAERAVVDVVMPASGGVQLYHKARDGPWGAKTLARLTVAGEPVDDVGAPAGPHTRAAASLAEALRHRDAPPDVVWELDVRADMAALMAAAGHHQHGSGPPPAIEWEDEHAGMNAASDPSTVTWVVRDAATGAENMDAAYTFRQGSHVNILLRNLPDSPHPMQHPFHLHGQRFVVQRVDGAANPDPAWRDTVLVPTGSEVLITVEMSNPGTWMYHCHISEHMEAGMMGTFTVA